jgi:2-amino-4-hydroxy-6-hydroxymethyldihydropteridine diphosphokinase
MKRQLPVDAVLGLGSNLGSRESHLAHAIMGLEGAGEVRALSSVYETDPVGFTDQGPFLNMVVAIRTEREPRELLRRVRELERERGRVTSFRNAPRTLDIDVLLFGAREVWEEGLIVPHPRMRDRPFVLVPLLEVDPGAVHPVTGVPFREDLARLAGGGPLDDLRAAGERLGVRRVMAGEELLDESDG